MDNNFKNSNGIQFNGWNFAHICDWMLDQEGTYPAQYFEEININGLKVKRHDWIIKQDNGSFILMTNEEHKDWVNKMNNLV